MAVIQDEQGNSKPIKTDTSHVFDVNGNPLHGELFIGETIASDDVEEIDPFAHMSDVEELIKFPTFSGTTDSNGILTTTLTTSQVKIMNAWVEGVAVDRVVFTIVNNSRYKFLITNSGFTPAANQTYTVAYVCA